MSVWRRLSNGGFKQSGMACCQSITFHLAQIDEAAIYGVQFGVRQRLPRANVTTGLR